MPRTHRHRLALAATAAAVASGAVVGLAPQAAQAALPTCDTYRVWDDAYVPDYSPTGSVDCELFQGAHGDGVKQLQITLNYCCSEHLDTDGDYGPLTREAVRRAQRAAGAARDGRYGPETRKKILHRGAAPIFGCKRVS